LLTVGLYRCLPPVKLHCSLLAEDAVKAAIANYNGKRASATAAATDLAGTTKAFAKEGTEAATA
jgi:iron-sulfur cluster assembly enzyme ISCU, mitochondrial